MFRHLSFLRGWRAASAFIVAFGLNPAVCLEQKKAESARPPEPKPSTSAVQQFCSSNAAAIGDAQIGWQISRLTALEAQIQKRVAELEARKAEYVDWMRKRDDALKQAEGGVVAIYARMRPDAAALQLAAMEDAMAAAILAKLSARVSSAILNEMEAGRAARLTHRMAGPDVAPDEKKS